MQKRPDYRKIIWGFDQETGKPIYDFRETGFYEYYYPKMKDLIPNKEKLLKLIKKEKKDE